MDLDLIGVTFFVALYLQAFRRLARCWAMLEFKFGFFFLGNLI